MDATLGEGLQVVTKLRGDANMRFRYTGERTGKQGRPNTYDGKVDWHDLSRFDKVDSSDSGLEPDIELYAVELYARRSSVGFVSSFWFGTPPMANAITTFWRRPI